jgi:hypothetical protein
MSDTCAACHRAIGADQKPVRDKSGRSFHRACAEKLMAQRSAAAKQPAQPKGAMDALLEGAEKATALTCPGCGNLLHADAKLCVRCGHNFQTGKSLHTRIEKAPKEKGEKSAGGPQDTAALAGLGVGLVIGGLGIGSYFVPMLFLPFIVIWAVASLGVGLWSIVAAFQMSVTTGLLYIFLPFYSLYWILKRCESHLLKSLYGAVIAGGLMFTAFGWLGVGKSPIDVAAEEQEAAQVDTFE